MNPPSPWIERLNLMPHPEGGFYSEVYRCPTTCSPGGMHEGTRNLATCIYYLLPMGSFSAFHRLTSDELWTHADGGSVTIHTIDSSGNYSYARLGVDIRSDAVPLALIPSGCWFAAEPARHADSLVTCTVTPGFDFRDFVMASKEELRQLCPSQAALIERLCAAR